MKGGFFFKHKANMSQIFLSTATAYSAFIPYTEFYFHYASASETSTDSVTQ